jgi:polyferredoxin
MESTSPGRSESTAQTVIAKAKPIKNPDRPIGRYRFLVQLAFVALCLWIGIEFHLFVKQLQNPAQVELVSRPPGVEGFLPISALMSLYYFFQTGVIHQAHPAGMFILCGILLVSLVVGKSFCSWICPVGFISELLGDLSDRLFGRRIRLYRWLDIPLRSLKYLFLAFLVWSIFFVMSTAALRAFLDSPYNLMADVKMYYFFAEISSTALIVLAVLFALSLVVRGFWCRYLCPYGALLGILSLVSPVRIRRRETSCIDCGKCAKVCPSFIRVDRVRTVVSDECTSCLNCLDACPVADTLALHTVGSDRKISKRAVLVMVVAGFVLVTGIGMITGNWKGGTTAEEYRYHHQHVHTYGHPTGTREIRQLEDRIATDCFYRSAKVRFCAA